MDAHGGEQAAAAGLSNDAVAAVVQMATDGSSAGLVHDPDAREDVPIVLRLPRTDRGSLGPIEALRLGPRQVSVAELTRASQTTEGQSI